MLSSLAPGDENQVLGLRNDIWENATKKTEEEKKNELVGESLRMLQNTCRHGKLFGPGMLSAKESGTLIVR
jgi:hypothetical protein